VSETAEPTKTKQVDFLSWLRDKGFVVDDMESQLDDTWKPFKFSFKEQGTTIAVEWQAKRGLDATKPNQHTLIQGVKIINAPGLTTKRTDQADLGPIRRDEIDPHPLLKYPRNMKCFCGSGKKFKLCHLSEIPMWCLKKDAPRLKAMRDAFVANFSGRDTQIQETRKYLEKKDDTKH
jgi:hypothetical protein